MEFVIVSFELIKSFASSHLLFGWCKIVKASSKQIKFIACGKLPNLSSVKELQSCWEIHIDGVAGLFEASSAAVKDVVSTNERGNFDLSIANLKGAFKKLR